MVGAGERRTLRKLSIDGKSSLVPLKRPREENETQNLYRGSRKWVGLVCAENSIQASGSIYISRIPDHPLGWVARTHIEKIQC